MFVKIKKSKEHVLGYNVKGLITHQDYEGLIPEVEEVINKFGKVSLYMDVSGFENATLEALIDDAKTYFKFKDKLEKVAIVGNNKIEELIVRITAVFLKAECKYFDSSEMDEAWAFISK
jgi:hypothetical protein